jgi:hypothetical protein
MKITGSQRTQLTAYVEILKHLLHLDHWTIDVTTDPGDDFDEGDAKNAEAGTLVRFEANVATLYVPETLFQQPPDRQRQTLLHEFMHMYLSHLMEDCDAVLRAHLHEPTYDAVKTLISREYERTTDSLASAIAEHYPLPALAKR